MGSIKYKINKTTMSQKLLTLFRQYVKAYPADAEGLTLLYENIDEILSDPFKWGDIRDAIAICLVDYNVLFGEETQTFECRENRKWSKKVDKFYDDIKNVIKPYVPFE